MNTLTAEAREAIMKKALSRGSQTLKDVAKANNISRATLLLWMKNRREGKPLVLSDRGRPPKQKRRDQDLTIKHVLATTNLDAEALGAYCREQGIYRFQLEQWRNELMNHYIDLDKINLNDIENKIHESNENKTSACAAEQYINCSSVITKGNCHIKFEPLQFIHCFS